MNEHEQTASITNTYTDEFYSADELVWVENWDRVKASMRREVGNQPIALGSNRSNMPITTDCASA